MDKGKNMNIEKLKNYLNETPLEELKKEWDELDSTIGGNVLALDLIKGWAEESLKWKELYVKKVEEIDKLKSNGYK